MSGPWEDFGGASSGPWEDFAGKQEKPKAIGQAANADFLRAEMQNADPITRNLAGFGVAASDTWEGLKQWFGKQDNERIAANKVIRDEAPVSAFAGDVATTALPFFAAPGATVGTAAKIGAAIGATRPVEGEGLEMLFNKGKSIATDAALSGAGQKVANVAGKMFAGKADDLARSQVLNAERDATLKAALDNGAVVPPSSVNPSWWNQLKEGVGGKIATAQQVSNRNEGDFFGKLSRKAVGLADDAPLTSEALQEVRNAAFAKGYAPVRQFGAMPTDQTYIKTLDDLVAKHSGAANSFPKLQPGMHGGPATPVQPDVVKALEPLRVPRFESGDAIDQIAVLREDATKAYRAGDTGMGKALKGAAKALEDQIERNLKLVGKDGAGMLDDFRNARKLMAKAHTVEDAIVQGGGTINPRKYAARVQAGKPMSDELEIMGRFANNFPRASQPAAQVAGPAVSKLNSFASMVAGGGGFGLGGPAGAAVGAALPFIVPGAARAQMLSRGSQNALLDMYRLGLPARMSRRLVQHAPVGFTVAGSNAFLE
jgi:hypothetical protein